MAGKFQFLWAIEYRHKGRRKWEFFGCTSGTRKEVDTWLARYKTGLPEYVFNVVRFRRGKK
jgi:hypothetical protein